MVVKHFNHFTTIIITTLVLVLMEPIMAILKELITVILKVLLFFQVVIHLKLLKIIKDY